MRNITTCKCKLNSLYFVCVFFRCFDFYGLPILATQHYNLLEHSYTELCITFMLTLLPGIYHFMGYFTFLFIICNLLLVVWKLVGVFPYCELFSSKKSIPLLLNPIPFQFKHPSHPVLPTQS